MTTDKKEEKIEIPKLKLFLTVTKELKHIKKSLPLLLLLLLGNVFFMNIEPYLYKLIIDAVEQYTKSPSNSMLIYNIYLLLFMWWAFTVIWIIFRSFYAYFRQRCVLKDWADYINKIWLNFLSLSIDRHTSTWVWEQQKIYDRWAEAVWEVGHYLLETILPNILSFTLLMWIGLFVNWQMAIFSIILMPIWVLVITKIGNSAYKKQKEANKKWEEFYSRFSDALSNIYVIKIFSRENKEIKLEKETSDAAIVIQNKVWINWIQLSSFSTLLVIFSRLIVFAIWVNFIIAGKMWYWDLFMFFIISNRIYSPIQELLNSYQQMIKNLANFYKSQKIIDEPKEIDNGTLDFTWINTNLEFKNIDFSYPENDRKVLKNINLEIKKWQKVALIGHTGSGKTTITKLLSRFYPSNENSGEIKIDWTNINDFRLQSLRSKMATVFQETTLFNWTILHNLEYVKDWVTMDEIVDACKKARIYDFIIWLEKWFETEVGERWLKLSGWEKQRLSLARVILNNPDILILDEATSALDSKTESLIQEALEELMEWKTSIIIAHRLSTIKNVDKIFLLDNWEIVWAWTHKELYESNATYKEMVDYQKNGFIE